MYYIVCSIGYYEFCIVWFFPNPGVDYPQHLSTHVTPGFENVPPGLRTWGKQLQYVHVHESNNRTLSLGSIFLSIVTFMCPNDLSLNLFWNWTFLDHNQEQSLLLIRPIEYVLWIINHAASFIVFWIFSTYMSLLIRDYTFIYFQIFSE